MLTRTSSKSSSVILIVIDSMVSFDQYAVQSQIRYHGFDPTESLVKALPRKVSPFGRKPKLIILQFVHSFGLTKSITLR